MIKNNWHIIAISSAVSIVTLMINNYLLLLLHLIWLLLLILRNNISCTVFLLSIGSTLFFLFYIPSPSTLSNSTIPVDDKPFLVGKITSPIYQSGKKLEFTINDQESNANILVVYFPSDQGLDSNILEQLKYGAVCHLKGKFSPVEKASNPYQFDYQMYLLKKGISNQFILTSEELYCDDSFSFMNYIYQLRTNLIQLSDKKLSSDTASWLQALVLGHDGLLDEHVIELFQRWGLSHILAISGLHIGIVVIIIYIILVRFSLLTKEKAQWVVVIFLPIYAVLAGSQPSVWRASLMVLFVIWLRKTRVKYSLTDILSIVFLLCITSNKLIVYHIGFQFSFIVTFGLLLSNEWMNGTRSNLVRLLQLSFVAQMIILPLQIYYFSLFQPLSILLNVMVVPYFSILVIPSMFLLLLFIYLPSPIIKIFETAFLSVHNIFLKMIEIVDTYANYPIITGEVSIYIAIVYYILFILMMSHLEKRNNKKAFQFGFLICLLLFTVTVKPYFSPIGTVTMLDIGQGDAFIIELPYRKGVFIVDAGATFSYSDFKPNKNIYNQVIKPYLHGRGIHKIDALFISHDDLDHDGSVQFLVEGMQVEEIIVNAYYEDTKSLQKWSNLGVRITEINYNEKVMRKGHTFYVLSPDRDKGSSNENSLVLYTKIGGMSWLFTGDIGKETEKEIIHKYENLSIDVLKVGHHGSSTSTDKIFINQIKPKYALISVGKNNRYGHPTNEVIESLLEEDITIYRTDLHGAVQYYFDENVGAFNTYFSNNERISN